MALLLKWSLFALLALSLSLVPAEAEGEVLRRQKREWIIPPRRLQENHDYTGLEYIAKIHSDKANITKIYYTLSGPGVDQPPHGVFNVNRDTGFVRIYAILDREEIPVYRLKAMAKYGNGVLAERVIDLNIIVEDVNDCVPVIKAMQVGYINESSAAGTVVMKVIATDDDEENTIRSKVSYSIVEHVSSAGMFFINSETGEVVVRQNTLDREKQDKYTLTIKASDMNGDTQGLHGTGKIEINILDINDNIPTLEKEFYEGSIEENTINVEVLRIRAVDMDLIHTDNWLAVFEIISGNEAGYFTITTDQKTNEGIITIRKPLDYEELKTLNLAVTVTNKARYNFGSKVTTDYTGSKSYPVKINVVNQKEGPRFQPSVKVVTISEDHTSTFINKIITSYTAIDSDTLKPATNVRYVKIRDSSNWLIIDEKTADIRLNKLPDRESKFLINGTYYAEIICITNELPAKTATGTIAIQVEDFNDHCPQLMNTAPTLCLENDVIYITAVDEDQFPNSAPFDFSVEESRTEGKWTVEPLNGTSAILRSQANWPNIYKVAVKVKDQQGKSCDDLKIMDITLCTCKKNTKHCESRAITSSTFGAGGVLLMLLGLLLLLLVPLLLMFCLCGGGPGNFKVIPFDTKQQLISYHTEGQGEDKAVPLVQVPVEVDGGVKSGDSNAFGGMSFQGEWKSVGGAAGGWNHAGYKDSMSKEMNSNFFGANAMAYGEGEHERFTAGHERFTAGHERFTAGHAAEDFGGIALSRQFLEEYYLSKSDHAAQQFALKDSLLVYDFEGQESLAGSVGCCSLLENDDDLEFLNDLGPKFRTLAEICQGSTLVTESVNAGISVSPPRPVAPDRASNHTRAHTHAKTVRDREHVSEHFNASGMTSGSSTVVREEHIAGVGLGSSSVSKVHVQDNIVIPSQTLLIQQPAMYYAAAPMYVVEPKPEMVLVAAGAQAVGQVGQVGVSQGSVQVGGFQGSQGVVLVDRQVGIGGAAGQMAQGLSQGTLSRSGQVLVVENRSSGGGQGAHLAQAFVQTGQASTEQGSEVRGQGVQLQTQSFSLGSFGPTGSDEGFTLSATPKVRGSQRVVVQHKKVSVTERNTETSSRA